MDALRHTHNLYRNGEYLHCLTMECDYSEHSPDRETGSESWALAAALRRGELPLDLQQRIIGGSLTIGVVARLMLEREGETEPPEITTFAVAVAEYMSAVRALHEGGHCAAVCGEQSPDPDGKGWHPTHAAEVARYEAANTSLELWLSVEAMR